MDILFCPLFMEFSYKESVSLGKISLNGKAYKIPSTVESGKLYQAESSQSSCGQVFHFPKLEGDGNVYGVGYPSTHEFKPYCGNFYGGLALHGYSRFFVLFQYHP